MTLSRPLITKSERGLGAPRFGARRSKSQRVDWESPPATQCTRSPWAFQRSANAGQSYLVPWPARGPGQSQPPRQVLHELLDQPRQGRAAGRPGGYLEPGQRKGSSRYGPCRPPLPPEQGKAETASAQSLKLLPGGPIIAQSWPVTQLMYLSERVGSSGVCSAPTRTPCPQSPVGLEP